jgi:glutathione synthase/RimK-type ligase-like ATP-grasp enzyme
VTRIALATCAAFPDLDEDGPELLAALAAEGLEVDVRAWDSDTDWTAYALVVIRTTWDYWTRYDEFLAWTRRVPQLVNSPDVIAWNTDKTYLRRLAAAGIPVVPTTWLQPGDSFAPPDHAFVVKPTVSAGARDTAAYPAGDEAAVAHVQALLAAGRPVMVQPYLDGVEVEGETAVLVFDGQVSHAARKGAILRLGTGVDNAFDGYAITPRDPSPEERELALRVLEEVRSWGDDLLYARVDLLPGPVLIELEVTEPSLFLRHAPGAAQRYAAAVRRRVSTPAATQLS